MVYEKIIEFGIEVRTTSNVEICHSNPENYIFSSIFVACLNVFQKNKYVLCNAEFTYYDSNQRKIEKIYFLESRGYHGTCLFKKYMIIYHYYKVSLSFRKKLNVFKSRIHSHICSNHAYIHIFVRIINLPAINKNVFCIFQTCSKKIPVNNFFFYYCL